VDKIFIIKSMTIDRAAAGAVMTSDIAALDHEGGDDAMELAALVRVQAGLCVFGVGEALAELAEVLAGLGHLLIVQLELDRPELLSSRRDFEKHRPTVLRLADHPGRAESACKGRSGGQDAHGRAGG